MKKLLMMAVAAQCLAIAPPVLADIEIGVINSLSGNFATFGQRYQAGMEVALEEINAAGGVRGESILLNVQDDRSEAKSALTAVESLNRQNVPLIMGSYSSGITGPMAQLMTRQKIPLIVLGSADNSITKPGSPWVFRAKHNSTIVAKTYFDYFNYLRETFNEDLSTIAIIYGNGAWPASLAEEGEKLAAENGYKVVGNQSYDQGTTDFRPILNRFRSDPPDLLYIVAYAEDGVAIARQIKEVNLNAKAIAIDTGAALPSFISQVGEISEYVATVVSWSKDVKYEGTEDLYERLKAKIGEEPTFYEAEGYLALRVAADALERAESLDRDDVRNALAETDLDTPVTHVRFENNDGFQGQNPIRSLVLQIQDGEHVTVFPKDLAAEEVRFPTPAWENR
jgi:branched-chain amino acid transport system substrate-binding protein